MTDRVNDWLWRHPGVALVLFAAICAALLVVEAVVEG